VFLCDCVRKDGPGDRRRPFYGCTVAGPSLLMWGCAPAEASLACRAGQRSIAEIKERDRGIERPGLIGRANRIGP
jgi:hypothetical protein